MIKSFFTPVARTQIAVSTGAWVLYNLNSAITVPPGATFAFVEYDNPGSSGSSYGILDYDKPDETPWLATSRTKRFDWVKMSSSGEIKLYSTNSTTGKFYIRGYSNHITAIADYDVSTQIDDTTSCVITASALPPAAAGGAALVRTNLKQITMGATNQIYYHPLYYNPATSGTSVSNSTEIVPLDSNLQFSAKANSVGVAGNLVIVGWLPPGAFVQNINTPKRYMPPANSWVNLAELHSDSIGFWKRFDTSTSYLHDIATGDYTGAAGVYNSNNSQMWNVPNANGVTAYWSSASASADDTGVYFIGSLVSNLSTVNIVSFDKFKAGETTTMVLSESATPTKLEITDGVSTLTVSSFSGSGTTWTFTVPDWVAGAASVRAGSVGVTAYFGSEKSSRYLTTYRKTGYSAVLIQTLNQFSVNSGLTPALQVGDELAYEDTKCVFYNNGIGEGDYLGNITIWYYSSADRKRYSFLLKSATALYINFTDMVANHSSPIWDGDFPLGNRP